MSETAAPGLRPGSDAATIRNDPRVLRGQVDVVDFALVTYLVPAERLEGRLPRPLQPQTFDHDGGRMALVSASCFLNRELRWAGGPSPRLTAYQSTYRTYVTCGRDVGAFFFASYVSTAVGTWGQRLGLADTRRATFDVEMDLAPRGGYRTYRAVIAADDGRAHVELTADRPAEVIAPFTSPGEHVRFITHRLHGYSYSIVGIPVDAQVEHAEMAAFGGHVVDAHFPPLIRLGLVPAEEQHAPHSVLVSPGARFDLLAPAPLIRRRGHGG